MIIICRVRLLITGRRCSCSCSYFSIEPAETWSVEHVMHWWLLRAQSEVQATFDETEDRLRTELETGKSSLWQDHQQVSDKLHPNENSNPNNINASSSEPQNSMVKPQPSQPAATSGRSTRQRAATQEEQPETEQLAADTIRADVLQGEYEGMYYLLKPTARFHAWVGRSQGKKFREKGISLPKDLEVSTTHGKFEYRRGKFVFIDDGSTNGSLVNGERLEAKVAVPLETGMEIMVGQTLLKITLADK